MLLVSYVFGMLFAIASAFSTTYMMFAVLRFFTGFFINGIVIVSTVLSNERTRALKIVLEKTCTETCMEGNVFVFPQLWSGWT